MTAHLFTPGPHWVQVRMFGVSVCSRVSEAWVTREGKTMWKLELLEPLHGSAHFPDARLMQCSGLDGRCVCAGEVGPHEAVGFEAGLGVGFCQAGVVAPPDSLNIETLPVSSLV